jgi:Mg/Co/Ni transporter MgtE
MSPTTRVFVARLAALGVFDPLGDQVGRVRDVVVHFNTTRRAPPVIGLVVEVSGRRRVFVPMARVTSIDAAQVITTGLVNLRRFEQRAGETLVLAELFERAIAVNTHGESFKATVEDIAIQQEANRDWLIVKVFARKESGGTRSLTRLGRRRGETVVVDIHDVSGLHEEAQDQSVLRLLASYRGLKPADLAEAIHDLSPARRAAAADALDDDSLADVLEELPEDHQVEILRGLGGERAADVLEAMEPDDAADLLLKLSPENAEELLRLMEPDEAADLRRLLAYDEDTAGGLMTTDPVILGPDATIAEALAVVRRAELSPALAATVFVCRSPLETPTGRYLGLVHIQRLLRDPPHAVIGSILDKDLQPLPPDAPIGRVTRMLATYNLVGVPVVDQSGRLLGAVTVDDVLDHILPDDWREERHEKKHQEKPQVTHGP